MTIIAREGDVPLCIFWVRCGAERKGEELLRPNPIATRQMVSLSLASSICLGLSESEQNPIFSPVVRRSDSRIEQWSEILRRPSQTVSGKKGGKARSPALGCGDGKKGALAARSYGSKRRGV